MRMPFSAAVVSLDRREIRREVDRIVGLAAVHSRSILGTGALPYETPPENVRFIRECLA